MGGVKKGRILNYVIFEWSPNMSQLQKIMIFSHFGKGNWNSSFECTLLVSYRQQFPWGMEKVICVKKAHSFLDLLPIQCNTLSPRKVIFLFFKFHIFVLRALCGNGILWILTCYKSFLTEFCLGQESTSVSIRNMKI